MKQYKEEYVTIHGYPQYLLHYPGKSSEPVILFLHGGPGQSESIMAYAVDDFPQRNYTIVYHDQRGAGKTKLKNKKDQPTMDELIADLLEVILYLKKSYHKEKIILLGHSWGSVLGSIFALTYPEHVLAYIGSGQLIDMQENERYAYMRLKTAIEQTKNKKDLEKLKSLGQYPSLHYSKKAYNIMGKFRRLQGKYGLGMKIDLHLIWLAIKCPITRVRDLILFIMPNQSVDHLMEFLYSFTLRSYQREYQVPVYYILGDRDQQVLHDLSSAYFNEIKAPKKELYMIKNAGHLMMLDNTKAYQKIIMKLAGEYKLIRANIS